MKPGDKLLINGTVQCEEREMPYLAHSLKAEVEDIISSEDMTIIFLTTDSPDLDALGLYLDPDLISVVSDPNWRDRVLAFPITL